MRRNASDEVYDRDLAKAIQDLPGQKHPHNRLGAIRQKRCS